MWPGLPGVGAWRAVRRLAGPGLAMPMAAVLVASLLVVVELPARPAAAAPAAAGKRVCPASRPDEASASITARMCGGRVRVDSLESETTEVYAQADGTLQADVSAGPVRMRQNNAWVPVDLSLARRPDGSVGAKAHPVGLTLSGPPVPLPGSS